MCFLTYFNDSVAFLACPGEVIKDGDIKCIIGEGMPMYRNPFDKGRLVVNFSVEFPEDNWISNDKIAELEKYLPERQEVIISDDAEQCELQKYNPRQDQYRQHNREIYDSDDEDQMGPRVQCASH